MSALILKNGRLLDPVSGTDEVGDLYLKDGVISEPFPEGEAETTIELEGREWVCPGFIDSMVHLCEPGMTSRESIETGTAAAAAGGFTAVINMPGNAPPTDEVHRLLWVKNRVREVAQVKVHCTATVSRGMEGELLAPIGSLHREGAVALTDHTRCLQNNELMRRALEYASMFDIPILDHCRDESLSPGGVMNEGYWSTLLGLRGWPSIAEEIMVTRNGLLAELTGGRIHCLQVTTVGSLRILREARERKIRLTGSATPHHLCLSDEELANYQTVFKFSPPLRTVADRDHLREAVKAGVIEFLCSDHSPHCTYEKEVEFDDAPFGAPGVETAVGATLTALVHEAGQEPLDYVALWTSRPAAYFGVGSPGLTIGSPADISVIDPDLDWTVEPKNFLSRSKMSPFSGRSLKGKAIYTIVDGALIWKNEL
jgi:dihydroorotase